MLLVSVLLVSVALSDGVGSRLLLFHLLRLLVPVGGGIFWNYGLVY